MLLHTLQLSYGDLSNSLALTGSQPQLWIIAVGCSTIIMQYSTMHHGLNQYKAASYVFMYSSGELATIFKLKWVPFYLIQVKLSL